MSKDMFPNEHVGEAVRSVFGTPHGPKQFLPPEKSMYWEAATTTASCMWGLYEAEYERLEGEDAKEYALAKWRKFLAINEVSLRMPIYTSRFFPELIALSWFFGFPSFSREQCMDRLLRVPIRDKAGKHLIGQLMTYRGSQDDKDDGVRGDEQFMEMYRKIRDEVQKLLKRERA